MAVAERSFSLDHPAAQGHFPGNPVIPGAVLLREVLRVVEEGAGVDLSSCRVASAKFFAPVRPGDRIAIEFSPSAAGRIRFTCSVGDNAVLKGEVQCGPIPAAS